MKNVALQDCIMQREKPVTAGSKILETFIAPFSAAVVDRLLENGYEITERMQMDEFGIPGEAPPEPTTADLALCNDLFGTYRKLAAENGCACIHPTYGTVSRYGLIQQATSMDQIGVYCKDMREGFALLSHIFEKDAVSAQENKKVVSSSADEISYKHNLTIGIPDGLIHQANTNTQKAINNFNKKFQSKKIELLYSHVYKPIHTILSYAEISHNLSRYDGIKFGRRAEGCNNLNDLYTQTRSQGFGLEAKLAVIMGAMMLSQENYAPYYEKAMKLRRLIKEDLDFDGYDLIILPCTIGRELPTLTGLPAVAFSYEGCGIQLIANAKQESNLLSAWEVATA